MLPAFCDHQLTVVTPGEKTVHGDTVDDWSESKITVRTIENCWVEAKSTEENNMRRDVTRSGYDILIPDGVQLPTDRDRIRHPLSAGDYQVKGEVMPVISADGSLNHFFAYVERWSNRG